MFVIGCEKTNKAGSPILTKHFGWSESQEKTYQTLKSKISLTFTPIIQQLKKKTIKILAF